MQVIQSTLAPKLSPVVARPMRPLKTTSAIAIDPKFFLDKAERGRGAMYFYNNKHRQPKRRSEWVWASIVAQILFPTWQQRPINGKIYKDCKSAWDSIYKAWSSTLSANAISIKKEDSKFLAKVPILAFPNGGFPPSAARSAVVTYGSDFISNDLWKSTVESFQPQALAGRRVSTSELKPMGTLNEKDIIHLKKANAMVSFAVLPEFTVAFLELEFTKRESEFLTNSSWIEIRPMDFFGVIKAWVGGYYGQISRSPTFSVSLGKIAKDSDSKPSKPRLSEDSLLIDDHGVLMYMPPKLNSISEYETRATNAYMQPDGSFSALDANNRFVKPPPTMPVYVDWVNLKLAYTMSTGELDILPLDRVQAVNVTHIRRFLDRTLSHDVTLNFISLTMRLGGFFGIPDATFDLKQMVGEIPKLFSESDPFSKLAQVPIYALWEMKDRPNSDVLRKFWNTAVGVLKFIQDNPTNAYARYSVLTILELQAQLVLFTKYAPKYGEVHAADNTARKAYIEQGEDSNFKPEPVPFVLPGRGQMPHQVKVANLLRHDPDNAVIPVDAGGGKTTIICYEVAKNLKTFADQYCLIMCPSHLVAQYVKEFVYFFGSNINVIPITTYTIRRHGLKRLRQMIQSAPHNTVLVTDYHALTYRQSMISYGVAPIRIFPVVDFIREFPISYVAADESHYLKNGSSRNQAAAKIFSEAKKRRLASGTMVADTIVDLVRQTALMDPSIFGSVKDFIRDYALEVRGSKVTEWKPGAQHEIKETLKQNIVEAGAKRKEWAAILPFPVERFHPVSLSEEQLRTYNNILTKIREQLEKAALEDERLRNLLEGKVDPDEPELNIDALLKPYLARLEMFLTAPELDPLGKEVLKSPEDKVSPKARKVYEICYEHLSANTQGKILIFTNYGNSARAIYDNMPEDLKAQTIYYTAANKEECGAEFERNPDKKIMVGIETSMNTGLNLQFCSRLIRVESTWTPGNLEQGNSRIGRPNIKDAEVRKFVYYDWIIANLTIDVTKTSYLLAKIISKAKYDEAGNPKFDDLEVPPLFSMNLDTVFAMNDVEETLIEYFTKYESYKKALKSEYDWYREKNKDKLFTPDGKLRMDPIERADTPAESAIMKSIPYVPGMELYQANKLGLVRYDAFMKIDESDLEDSEDEDLSSEEGEGDEEESDEEDSDAINPAQAYKKALLAAEREKAIGLAVHTEFGDGEVIGLNMKVLKVQLPTGFVFRVRKLAAYVITKPSTSGKDIRTQLLKMSGELPIDTPVGIDPPAIGKQKNTPKKQLNEDEEEIVSEDRVTVRLGFTIINDFLGVQLLNTDNETAVRVAEAAGFKHSPAYYAAHVKLPRYMLMFFKGLQEKGFKVDKENNRACKVAFEQARANRLSNGSLYGIADANAIRNFYRMEFKPNPDRMHVNPYPLIQDGQLYLALPKNGQPGSVNAIQKVRVPNLKWYEYDSSNELVYFTPTKQKASAMIQKLLNDGVFIENIEELKKQFAKLRVHRTKVSEDE